jgi:hypothetical protein
MPVPSSPERRIIAYKVLSARDAQGLEVAVRAALDGSWQPFGFPFSHKDFIYQAMVQYA